jgi:hypothetical protein
MNPTNTPVAYEAPPPPNGDMDRGGKRSATPLCHEQALRKRRRRCALPAQSKGCRQTGAFGVGFVSSCTDSQKLASTFLGVEEQDHLTTIHLAVFAAGRSRTVFRFGTRL